MWRTAFSLTLPLLLAACGAGPSTSQSPGAAARVQAQEQAKRLGLPLERRLGLGNGVTLQLVFIPSGRALLGTKPGEENMAENEKQHEVKIDQPFYIGKCEVTQLQYATLMDCNPSVFMAGDYPVENLTWDDACAFCTKLSERTQEQVSLPTEEQWEYACRADSQTRFNLGDDEHALETAGWYNANSGGHSQNVGRKQPNAWGACDMHGNVWEWCAPKTGEKQHVVRGGSWMDDPAFCRSGSRTITPPDFKNSNVGFRILVSAVKQP